MGDLVALLLAAVIVLGFAMATRAVVAPIVQGIMLSVAVIFGRCNNGDRGANCLGQHVGGFGRCDSGCIGDYCFGHCGGKIGGNCLGHRSDDGGSVNSGGDHFRHYNGGGAGSYHIAWSIAVKVMAVATATAMMASICCILSLIVSKNRQVVMGIVSQLS